MEVVLNKSELMLLALLKASLNQSEVETSSIEGSTPEDWEECYLLAVRQGVMALAWDGVKSLPLNLLPPKPLKLKWALAVEKYEGVYARYCRVANDLTAFYAEKGIATMLLKGVGLSSYYPIPSHREGGDIDIFTYSADKQRLSDDEANRLADRLMIEQGIQVDSHSLKHSNFCYKGIPIENHKTFLDVHMYEQAREVEILLKESIRPQLTELLDGECKIYTPSSAFNTLFISFHAAQHYGCGVALHHLCDWAVLINQFGLNLPKSHIDERFQEAIIAFTCLCNRYLGTHVEVSDNHVSLADEVMYEILHPKFMNEENLTIEGKMKVFLHKTQRFFHKSRVNNRILYIPIWKRIWHSVLLHLSKPGIIFQLNPK